MRESNIEKKVCAHAKKTGWTVFKFTSATNGVPDRVFIKAGKHVFVEFKAPSKTGRPLQLFIHKKMRKAGALVFLIDDIQTGKDILDAI